MKLIKFYTTWCGPCKVVTNILREVDLTGVELVNIDAEQDARLAKLYDVSSVPVLIFEVNGVEVGRINGVAPPEVIEDMLNKR